MRRTPGQQSVSSTFQRSVGPGGIERDAKSAFERAKAFRRNSVATVTKIYQPLHELYPFRGIFLRLFYECGSQVSGTAML